MNLFRRLFGKKPQATPVPEKPATPSHERALARAPEQAVLVHLDGVGLPDDVYRDHDLATMEDQLVAVIEREGLGEYDGNETGPGETTLFMYGPDAERLFAGIQATLRGYPLCRGARVVIRRGEPGAAERVVRL